MWWFKFGSKQQIACYIWCIGVTLTPLLLTQSVRIDQHWTFNSALLSLVAMRTCKDTEKVWDKWKACTIAQTKGWQHAKEKSWTETELYLVLLYCNSVVKQWSAQLQMQTYVSVTPWTLTSDKSGMNGIEHEFKCSLTGLFQGHSRLHS